MTKKSEALSPKQQADFLRRMKEMQDEAKAGFTRKQGRTTMDRLGKAFSMNKSKGGTIKKMKKGMKVKGYAKGGKPDFLDLDKDGDTSEPMKTAAAGRNMKAKGGTIKKMKKGMKVKGYKAGGKLRTKGGAKGMMSKGGTIRKMKAGKMVTKGSTVKKTNGKAKVRGAGIARKGVRPVQMR